MDNNNNLGITNNFFVHGGKDILEGSPVYPEALHIHIVDEKTAIEIIKNLTSQVSNQKCSDQKHFTFRLLGQSHSERMKLVN